jgi:hypothetical protein
MVLHLARHRDGHAVKNKLGVHAAFLSEFDGPAPSEFTHHFAFSVHTAL